MRRGDIFALRLQLPKGIGHEQQGKRVRCRRASRPVPASLRSVDSADFNERQTCFVPTRDRARSDTDTGTRRTVGVVDVTRIGNLAGHLTPEEQWGVDTALQTVLGLR